MAPARSGWVRSTPPSITPDDRPVPGRHTRSSRLRRRSRACPTGTPTAARGPAPTPKYAAQASDAAAGVNGAAATVDADPIKASHDAPDNELVHPADLPRWANRPQRNPGGGTGQSDDPATEPAGTDAPDGPPHQPPVSVAGRKPLLTAMMSADRTSSSPPSRRRLDGSSGRRRRERSAPAGARRSGPAGSDNAPTEPAGVRGRPAPVTR